MSNKLTDLTGIGEKTAEKLQDKGIETADEAVEALERGDEAISGASSRVQSGVRQYGVDERGEVYDSTAGVRVTADNVSAVESLAGRGVSDLNNSGTVTRNSQIQGDSLLDLGRRAVEGASLTEQTSAPRSQEEIRDPSNYSEGGAELDDARKRAQTRFNITQMGFDAAAGLANVGRETIEEANRLREKAESPGQKGESTNFTRTAEMSVGDSTNTYEKEVRVEPREVAAAKRVHNARSPEAKRVDSRREAETVTGDFDKWVNQPSQVDFPGVDTPQRGSEVGRGFAFGADDEQQYEADVARQGGFTLREQSSDTDARDGRVQNKVGEILTADQDTQALVLGDLLPDEEQAEEIGLEPRGPDKQLFGGNQRGDFL
jgi:hypothetical protein